MIRLENVSKRFELKNTQVDAVRDVSLTINDGEIFGVIGYSGAGKSTLVRCINLLERPTSGCVYVNDVDLTKLSNKDLRAQREKIGMIFQQFNLMTSRTVHDNVAFPLHNKMSKEARDLKVKGLLDIVGLSDKGDAYPSQLSGGQKQRVAIARALANDPGILLCDEATSALDPQTTQSILKLLKRLNKELGITIVIITHEMGVIKDICDRVAVMENGYVKELDRVIEVFANPKADITKEFIATTSNMNQIKELLDSDVDIVHVAHDQMMLQLDFYGSNTKESIIAHCIRAIDVDVSIIFGNVEVIQDVALGSLVVVVTGNKEKRIEVLRYLNEQNVKVEVLKDARND
ncbi:methionine ABC transporter ATP-binding protein [Erysipelothrix larvae]|uniref:Methionine ABC transporter ATP-binding protein n=1 Tax=Erysipelothrix larvae TaxID=1514105 RepID=A0A109UH24_9FIRM|nr:ATP-binding cassette domain-containing protein [Erysipelothrix larvae]AMC93598.1 methionine ABC transporter ATP-binding protein [Erysipelothrix larvae]